jgi:hypothetical protein
VAEADDDCQHLVCVLPRSEPKAQIDFSGLGDPTLISGVSPEGADRVVDRHRHCPVHRLEGQQKGLSA